MGQTKVKRDTVNFICKATGDPIPTIRWRFNSVPVNESDKYQLSTKLLNYTSAESILTVKNVGSSDVGNYTCCATNGASTALSNGVLSISGMLSVV